MRILITGGAGFIGSATAKHLKEEGHDVRILDKKKGDLPGVEYLEGSITDPAAAKKATEGCDAVIHLAAQVSAPASIQAPEETFHVNVEGSKQVLEAAKQAGAKKVVLASSAAVYGEEPRTPTTEEEPLRPMSPYAESKIKMEELAAEYATSGLPTICLRFFNVYGPGQDPKSKYAAAIPAFITRALAGEEITIYGDGLQVRDFIFVEDVARALERALTTGEGEVNIASGKGITIKELAERIITLTGSQSRIIHEEPRTGDPRTSLADVSKAAETLAFTATTELEKGLEKTIAFFTQ